MGDSRILIKAPLSRRKLLQVLRASRPITVSDLCCLGNSEGEIVRNLVRLVRGKRSIKVLHPRLTIGTQAANILQAVISASQENSSRRRVLTRLVSHLLGANFHRSTLQTRELIETVSQLRAERQSYRSIAKKTNVSRSTVMRVLRAKRIGEGGDE